MANPSAQIQDLQVLLEQYRQNLMDIRNQIAKYGAGEVPINLLNKLDAERNNIQETKAELRKLGEFPDHLSGDPEEVETFPDRFIDEFPHPIAIACYRFNQAVSNTERFRRLDELMWYTIKYLAAISLAQYRSDSPQDDQLRSWLGGLSRSSLDA